MVVKINFMACVYICVCVSDRMNSRSVLNDVSCPAENISMKLMEDKKVI